MNTALAVKIFVVMILAFAIFIGWNSVNFVTRTLDQRAITLERIR